MRWSMSGKMPKKVVAKRNSHAGFGLMRLYARRARRMAKRACQKRYTDLHLVGCADWAWRLISLLVFNL